MGNLSDLFPLQMEGQETGCAHFAGQLEEWGDALASETLG